MKFVILHLCIFVNISLLFLPYKSFCADQQYEVCKKASYCGNQSIRFPFYINETTGYCGYPGFKINCINNNVLLMNISEARYKVHQIFYHNNSLIVSSALSLNSGFCNLARIRNLSLPSDGRLELQSTSNLILLSNCTLKSDEKFFKYKVGCDLRKINADWVLAMKVKDRNLSSAAEICKTVVIAPVHYYSEDGDTDYLKLIRNGFDLRWMATNCSNCEASAGICGYEGEPVSKFKCFCKDRPHTGACLAPSKGKLHVKLGLAGALAAGVMITAVLLYIFWSNCSCSKNLILSETGRNDSEKVKAFLKMHGNLTPKRFSYRDIKKMTQSFKSKLGQGGFGGVYKGELPDTRAVAVKILNTSKSDGGEFLNEVASISRTSHVNIVSLLGFCFEGPKRALVYEFMPNGSLEKFISHGKSSSVQLEWKTLNEIALGIARGLEYLHQGCSTRILHLDIKPHNILLDEKFSPKISDFGLAKLCLGKKSIISMLDMRGTPGYIAPEVFSRNFGGVSHKSDVYSYGMMILEMAGAKNNKNEEVNNCSSEKYFPEWIYDSLELDADQIGIDDISNEVEKESRRKMLIVGLWCIQSHPSNRPSMKRVLEMLEGKVESLRIPARPFLEFLEEPPETISTT